MAESFIVNRLREFSRLFAAGDYHAALDVVDALAADNPDEGRILWQRARTLQMLERFDEAREAVKQVLERRRDFAPALVLRAELGEPFGDYDPEPDLRQAVALDPKLGRARYALALLMHADEDKEEEARTQMDIAIDLDPTLHEAYAARGGWSRVRAWTDAGDGSHDVFRTYSGARIKREHLELALADFERAIAIKPLPSYRFARADLLQSLGRFDEAIEALDHLLGELHETHALFKLARDAREVAAKARGDAPPREEAPEAGQDPESEAQSEPAEEPGKKEAIGWLANVLNGIRQRR